MRQQDHGAAGAPSSTTPLPPDRAPALVMVVLALAAAGFVVAGRGGGTAPGPCPPGTPPLLCGEKLDVNAVTARELADLPGIGPSIAAAIVEDRAVNGPFASVDDLDRVTGVGPKTVAKLSAWLR